MNILLFDLPYRIFLIALAGMTGACMASFITCQAGRIVEKKDWIHGRSVCDSCGHVLSFPDLIPIFSYVIYKGRCRYCHKKIPVECLWTEAGMVLVYIILLLFFGLSVNTVRYWGLCAILLGLSLVDLKKYEIPDGYILAGIIWWFVTAFLQGGSILIPLEKGLAGAVIISGGMLVLSLIFDKITGKESLGGGDIKLFFMTGLYLGLACGLFNLILSCIIGLIFVVIWKQSRIPFGPSISIAVLITILFGQSVVSWYFGLF